MKIAAGLEQFFLRTTFILAWLCCATATFAQTAPLESVRPAGVEAGRVLDLTIDSPSLRGNLLETPSIRNVSVYLPPGYDTSARRYPVLYLLHGIFDSNRTWIRYHEIPALLDRLIARGTIPPLIAVMPDGGNRLGGGFYRNSATAGRWADFITKDLIGHVDGSFRTLNHPAQRAVIGHSMGGYGALHLAMTAPQFSIVWAMSPCCLAPVEDLGFGNISWVQLFAMKREEEVNVAIRDRDFSPVAALAILSAFRPDPSNPPLFVDFPFDIDRGEMVLDQEEYAEYLNEFPLHRVDESRQALLALRGLAMDYGNGDQFLHIPTATMQFSHALAELRIPHRFEVYEGDHRNQINQRLEQVILPWVGKLLDSAVTESQESSDVK